MSARKAQTVVVAVNPDELVDAIANKVAHRLEAKFGKQLADGKSKVEREADSIDTFADRLDSSRWTARRLIRQGAVEAVKIGDLLRIPNGAAQARRVLQECPEFEASAPRTQTAAVKRDPSGKFAVKTRQSSTTAPTTGEITESELEARHG